MRSLRSQLNNKEIHRAQLHLVLKFFYLLKSKGQISLAFLTAAHSFLVLIIPLINAPPQCFLFTAGETPTSRLLSSNV